MAEHPKLKRRLVIEAKGETSSKPETNRYGESFNAGQVKSHVARAFLTAASHVGNEDLVAIALPHNVPHQDCIASILGALNTLSIEVFWVSGDLRVSTQGIWRHVS